MIGVLAKPEQSAAVGEFFELFKTPWEFYVPERRYDVVVVTADNAPYIETPLLLVYGAAPRSSDEARGSLARCGSSPESVKFDDANVPIYCGLLTFEPIAPSVGWLATDCGPAAVRIECGSRRVIRIGYDLFAEVERLLTSGQPPNQAQVPTLDYHVTILRAAMMEAGVPFVEITPGPHGHPFAVCLTHDIDFVGIKRHRLDHSMWGFLYRATFGAIGRWLRGRISTARLLQTWRAAASLPLVYLGLARDFWDPFPWYLKAEENLPATYYLIPFKSRPGKKVRARARARRGTAYDVSDVVPQCATLLQAGCEVGLHGIDAWHDVAKGQAELARIAEVIGSSDIGVRMHWLLREAGTPRALEQAGFRYDSTAGYNETIGYYSGTTQVFRPIGVERLLELPLHVQDGALFFPDRLDLTEAEAWARCGTMIENATRLGGVLTILWHDRSHGPERFWGDFYLRLLRTLRSSGAWFGTAKQIVAWFQHRRDVHFSVRGDRTTAFVNAPQIHSPLLIRAHRMAMVGDRNPSGARQAVFEYGWDGTKPIHFEVFPVTAANSRSAYYTAEVQSR